MSEEGVGGHAAAFTGLGLFISSVPHCCIAQGGGPGGAAHMEQAAAPPASVPRALWQQWHDVGIRCGSLATETAFPLGIDVGVRPRRSER